MKSDTFGGRGFDLIVIDELPSYEPEDCKECGCEAGEFGDEDWDNGHYKCPQCGAVV